MALTSLTSFYKRLATWLKLELLYIHPDWITGRSALQKDRQVGVSEWAAAGGLLREVGQQWLQWGPDGLRLPVHWGQQGRWYRKLLPLWGQGECAAVTCKQGNKSKTSPMEMVFLLREVIKPNSGICSNFCCIWNPCSRCKWFSRNRWSLALSGKKKVLNTYT